jgi:hypothetical protein
MRNLIRQSYRAIWAIGTFLVTSAISSQGGTFTVLAPHSYTRDTGAAVPNTVAFSVPHPNTQYTLKAFTGGLCGDETELVSSGLVAVNGVQILEPNHFNQNVTEVDVPMTLQERANQAVSGSATDVAGNSASTSVKVKLDETPLMIRITSPANGATLFGQARAKALWRLMV